MVTKEKGRTKRPDHTPRVVEVAGMPDGIEFRREDFASERSWERLCLGLPVSKMDFVNTKQFFRYFIVTNRLYEGIFVCSGEFGSGKSLFGYWLAWMLRELFGKSSTFDVPPLDTYGYTYEYAQQFVWGEAIFSPSPPETLGRFRTIKSGEFTTELEKIGVVAEIEKEVERGNVSREEFNKQLEDIKLYGSTIVIDEAYDKLEKARRGNFAINLGHLMMKVRHFHNLFILISPKANRIDKGMAYDIRSHEVYAYKDPFTKICRYNVWWKAANKWIKFELTPSEWSFLWKTDNLISSTPLKIKSDKK
jgi:hypothetical protein